MVTISQISQNTFVRFRLEWEQGTSTISSSIEIKTPSCLKWTIAATLPCGLESTMHSSQRWGFWVFLMTCKLYAVKWYSVVSPWVFWIFLNMSLTSQAVVLGNGIQFSGHPVFIKLWNPQCFTMFNGQEPLATQQTTSALLIPFVKWPTFPWWPPDGF